jgi:hypothetical protein
MQTAAAIAFALAAVWVLRIILRHQEERIIRESLRKYIRHSLGEAV